MSKQMEEFEAWIVREKRGYRDEKHGLCTYEPGALNRYWEAWQASRAATLEEAAKEVERHYSYDPEADGIAASVRALKEQS